MRKLTRFILVVLIICFMFFGISLENSHAGYCEDPNAIPPTGITCQ